MPAATLLSLLAALGGCATTTLGPEPVGPPPPPPAEAGPPPDATARLGPPVVLAPSGKLGLEYFPDMPVTILAPPPHLRALVVAGVGTYLVEGTDLAHLEHAEEVLGRGPRGAIDNGYAGIAGAVEYKGHLYAAYHAEDQEGMPALPLTGGVPGFHASIGLATSADGGRTWTRLGAAVTSPRPKGWTAYPGQADTGTGEPWLVRSRDGAWWFLYYSDHTRDGRVGVQICLARAPATGPPAPGAFVKWHRGAFSEPGLGGRDTPVMSGEPFDQSDAFSPHVVHSAALGRYVMTFNLNTWKEYVQRTGLRRSGMYLATSVDGVRWSRPEPMAIGFSVDVTGLPVSWHPAIVWDPGSSTAGWLVYGHSDRWCPRCGGTPHHLVGRRIELSPAP
jgi:hypothetical protein